MTALAAADDARALLPFEIRYDDEALYVESPDVPVSIVIHGDDEADARSIAERIAAMMNAAPATPAPADGAPGERVSVDLAALRAMEDVLALPDDNDPFWLAECLRHAVVPTFEALQDTAAPLPAPAASAGVGAETISDEVHDAIAMLMTDCYRDGATGVETAVAEHSRQRLIAAHLDALSTAAAPVRPDRAAVEALVKTIRLGIPLPGCMTGPSEPCGACRTCKAWSACAALLALVFGDSAPGEDGTR